MSRLEKALQRLKSVPKDYTYSEAKYLLGQLGFLEYKGYYTHIEIDFEANMFYGEIEDISDFVNFMSDIPNGANGIIQEFHSAVDDYLAFCSELGEAPNIPDYAQRVAEYA